MHSRMQSGSFLAHVLIENRHELIADAMATHADVTACLVAIAGSFIGFHIGVIVGLLPSPLMFYITAAIGAAGVLWLWRGK